MMIYKDGDCYRLGETPPTPTPHDAEYKDRLAALEAVSELTGPNALHEAVKHFQARGMIPYSLLGVKIPAMTNASDAHGVQVAAISPEEHFARVDAAIATEDGMVLNRTPAAREALGKQLERLRAEGIEERKMHVTLYKVTLSPMKVHEVVVDKIEDLEEGGRYAEGWFATEGGAKDYALAMLRLEALKHSLRLHIVNQLIGEMEEWVPA